MSAPVVGVRCRNGAIYLNPIVVFREGFICFSAEEPPELVLWTPLENPEGEPPSSAAAVLERIMGAEGFCDVQPSKRAERVRPGSDPWVFSPAAAYVFQPLRRIPVPLIHEGTERYNSRVVGPVFEYPASPLDASEMEIKD